MHFLDHVTDEANFALGDSFWLRHFRNKKDILTGITYFCKSTPPTACSQKTPTAVEPLHDNSLTNLVPSLTSWRDRVVAVRPGRLEAQEQQKRYSHPVPSRRWVVTILNEALEIIQDYLDRMSG